MLAAHFDNWIFLLLVAVAMLLRWLTSVANKASKGSDDSDEVLSPPEDSHKPAQTDEERMRKFLEALGQPAGSQPPPRVERRPMDVARAAREARMRAEQAKRAAEQAKRIFVPRSPLPPITTVPPPVPVEAPPAAAQVATEEGPSRERMAALKTPTSDVYEITDTGRAARSPAASTVGAPLLVMLRSRSGLRNAIVLREVFGPPRSVQPLELL